VRVGNFKLIEWYEDSRVELYDLKNDLGEQRDLARENPSQAARLSALLRGWRKQVGAQMPVLNPDYRTASKTIHSENRAE
jgi:hypothetical protein